MQLKLHGNLVWTPVDISSQKSEYESISKRTPSGRGLLHVPTATENAVSTVDEDLLCKVWQSRFFLYFRIGVDTKAFNWATQEKIDEIYHNLHLPFLSSRDNNIKGA